MTPILLLFIFFTLLFYYCYFLISTSKGIKAVNKKIKEKKIDDFVTVIIPFRNEANNLLNSLKSITNQNFPKDKLEVIYVDDNSDDNSYELLLSNINEDYIHIIKAPQKNDSRAHKKHALNFAISQAKGDIIITTDADCVHNANWLKTMVNRFDTNTAFVSGPVNFNTNGSMFQNLQKIEFAGLILTGAGLIGNKTPIICNAANLGFRKSVFYEVGGYSDNLNLSSGDDEFLMQKISATTNYEISFCFDNEAMSYTNPNKSINEFYNQRKRWASKGFYYVKKSTVIKLILIFLFYLCLPIQFILGLTTSKLFIISFIVSIICKTIIEYKIVMVDGKSLFGKFRLHEFIIAEFIHIPYIIIAGISGVFGNYNWKGRQIKR